VKITPDPSRRPFDVSLDRFHDPGHRFVELRSDSLSREADDPANGGSNASWLSALKFEAAGQRPARSARGQCADRDRTDRSGNYRTDVEIDGHFIQMMVDTGATYVSLTDADANAVGLRPPPSDYTYRTMTANGMGVAAKVRIAELRIGPMQIDNIEAFVMPPGVLGTSLLGMSALRRLGSVEISSGQLVLRQ
jgi:aspartyl protease family protein